MVSVLKLKVLSPEHAQFLVKREGWSSWTSGCQWCVYGGARFAPRECLIMTGDLLGSHRWDGDAGISWEEARCLAAHVQRPTLCDPTDCSLPGSSVPGISQVRTLEWVVMPFFRGSSCPRDRACVCCIGRCVLYHLSHQHPTAPTAVRPERAQCPG